MKRYLLPADLITITQAAEILGVSAQTLRRWDRLGTFKARRHPLNGYRLYSRTKLTAWAKELALPNMRAHYDIEEEGERARK